MPRSGLGKLSNKLSPKVGRCNDASPPRATKKRQGTVLVKRDFGQFLTIPTNLPLNPMSTRVEGALSAT